MQEGPQAFRERRLLRTDNGCVIISPADPGARSHQSQTQDRDSVPKSKGIWNIRCEIAHWLGALNNPVWARTLRHTGCTWVPVAAPSALTQHPCTLKSENPTCY